MVVLHLHCNIDLLLHYWRYSTSFLKKTETIKYPYMGRKVLFQVLDLTNSSTGLQEKQAESVDHHFYLFKVSVY